jgi:Tfp pilus assembly protein PilF
MKSQYIDVVDAHKLASTTATLRLEFQLLLEKREKPEKEQPTTKPYERVKQKLFNKQKQQLKNLLNAKRQIVPDSEAYFRLVGQYNEILNNIIDNGLEMPLEDELLLDDDLLSDKYFEFEKQWNKDHPYTIEEFIEKSSFICMVEILKVESHTAHARVIRQYKGELPDDIRIRFFIPWGLSEWYKNAERAIIFLDNELTSLGLSGRMPIIERDGVEYAVTYNENPDFWLGNASISQGTLDGERVLLIELKLVEALINKNEQKKSHNYQKYELGRYYLNEFLTKFDQNSLDYLKKATEYFSEATVFDETFAKAHSGLAACYVAAGIYNIAPPEESFARALEPATKALEINNTLVEAHTSRAYAYMCYEWDWRAAEDAYKQALKINPDYALAHQGYAHLLGALERFPEAFREIDFALKIDPTSPIINVVYGFILYYKGDYEKSWIQFLKAKRHNRHFDATYYGIALACEPLALEYMKKGNSKGAEDMFKEAQRAAKRAIRFSHGNPVKIAVQAHVYALSGKEDKAQDELQQLIAFSTEQYVSPFQIATIYAALATTPAALGNHNQFLEYYNLALDYLEKAYEKRDQWLVLLNVEPRFAILHKDERFKDLIRKLNFPARHEDK